MIRCARPDVQTIESKPCRGGTAPHCAQPMILNWFMSSPSDELPNRARLFFATPNESFHYAVELGHQFLLANGTRFLREEWAKHVANSPIGFLTRRNPTILNLVDPLRVLYRQMRGRFRKTRGFLRKILNVDQQPRKPREGQTEKNC